MTIELLEDINPRLTKGMIHTVPYAIGRELVQQGKARLISVQKSDGVITKHA